MSKKRPPLQLMIGGRIPIEIGPVAEVKILEVLGEGGFGKALKVADTATSKWYALKVIGHVKPNTTLAQRIRLEAEVVIPSEFIVPVIGLCQWDPNTFLILFDYFPGRSLDDYLKDGALTADQRRNLLHRILLGVSDAHRHNVIHRDLKPANILVDETGMVKIIDFGISKFKDKKITTSGDLMGTPPYMALELFLEGSGAADARADIYALGHIFYELAMGRHFWVHRGWSLDDFANYVKRVPRPTDGVELDDFSCDFCDRAAPVLRRMVKLYREERYASIDQVLDDLSYDRRAPVAPPEDLHLRCPMLIVESGTNRGARTVLGLADGERRELGRADLAGNDQSISRQHLEFSRAGDRYFVRDLGSKNGTLLRGLALEPNGLPVEIQHSDRIKAGDIFLRFVFLKPEQ